MTLPHRSALLLLQDMQNRQPVLPLIHYLQVSKYHSRKFLPVFSTFPMHGSARITLLSHGSHLST